MTKVKIITKINHRKKKESTLLWFIIAIIPIVNFYFLWKVAKSVSGHEKRSKKREFLDHRKTKDSTIIKWFGLFLIPVIIFILSILLFYFGVFEPTLMRVLVLVAIVIGLYPLWALAGVVSGHERVYKKYEVVDHKEKKDSTLKWFVIGVVPLVDLYFIWKAAETISGH